MNPPTASAARNVLPPVGAVASRAVFAVPLAPEARLDLLRGMLCQLEDATLAGQHYLMEKVLPLLRRVARDSSQRLRPGELDVVYRSLEDLEHEAARLAPDPSTFGQKAQILVDVFAIA
jgi:hypothetical protein